ncbi:MAG: ribonuclease Z [Lachnospiraceae bacterium]|nr:ribonuclease Z [Lachnospiraceae bacterium]
MLDVCLLGTGGMMPLPKRWLTALYTRYNGSNLLIDCGEGTQIAMREAGLSPRHIDVICFTHYHGDHIAGLPGLLLGMGNADRTEPLTLIGPKGLERVVSSLRVIAPELPFPIVYKEITEKDVTFEENGYLIHAFRVNHNVTCYGYSLEIKRAGKFNVEAAKEKNIPLKAWNPLQKGNVVTIDGITYTPDMVMGAERKGIKVTYTTDTRPTEAIVDAAYESDLFICEGMYGDREKFDNAKKNKHMMFYEAAKLAREAEVKELWLTHFSPSLVNGKPYMKEVKSIFANAHLGKDGKWLTLDFLDEEE